MLPEQLHRPADPRVRGPGAVVGGDRGHEVREVHLVLRDEPGQQGRLVAVPHEGVAAAARPHLRVAAGAALARPAPDMSQAPRPGGTEGLGWRTLWAILGSNQ